MFRARRPVWKTKGDAPRNNMSLQQEVLAAAIVNPQFIAHFWAKIEKRENGCWEWTGPISDRYGRYTFRKRPLLTHRIAYALSFGVPSGNICHRCDNTKCCNPAHLFQGTQADNLNDMFAKGRASVGSRHPASKVKEADVLEIRRLSAEGHKSKNIGPLFGLSRQAVNDIIWRRHWKHL